MPILSFSERDRVHGSIYWWAWSKIWRTRTLRAQVVPPLQQILDPPLVNSHDCIFARFWPRVRDSEIYYLLSNNLFVDLDTN